MLDKAFVLPASYGQERLWLLDQAQPGNPVYNTVAPLRIRGRLDPDILARCLREAVSRHEVLRTVLRLDGVSLVQVVRQELDLPLDVVRVDDDPVPLIRDLADRPFDLAAGPLLRCHLLRLAPEESVLVVVMHHAIGDARSTEVLLGELGACYEAHSSGQEVKLPELSIQYPDFAAWQRDLFESGSLATQLDYWRQRLSDTAPLRLPVDRPRPARPTYLAQTSPLTVAAETVASLRGLGGGVTPFMVALAGYAAMLSRWSGQPDVVVALPTAGRDQPELEQLVGFFVGTLPVRVDLTGDPSFAALLRQARTRCLEAYAHSAVPFEKLVEAAQPGRAAGRMPLAQAWLVLQEPLAGQRFAGLEAEPVALPPTRVPFDVAVSLRDLDGSLVGELSGSADIFSPDTIRDAAASLVAILDTAARSPETPVSQLPFLLVPAPAQEGNHTATTARHGDGRPATSAEHLLVRLWSEVLGIDEVSVDEEFYALGGNSLRAVRVVTRAREYGLELPIETVLGEHTIRQLARGDGPAVGEESTA